MKTENEYIPMLKHPELPHLIRLNWFTEYALEDADPKSTARIFKDSIRWLKTHDELERFKNYRFVFSRNDKRLYSDKTKHVLLDLGKIRIKRETSALYHAFFIKEVYE